MVVEEGDGATAAQPRRRAPPTCSTCHESGHNRTQCTRN
jgi:cytochrome c553